MSREVLIQTLTDEQRQTIMKDLTIKIDADKSYGKQLKYVYPMEVTDNYVYVPFAYGRENNAGTFPRPSARTFPSRTITFDGELRPMQKEIKKEAIQHLNTYGSTIISAYPGAGKTCTSIYLASKIRRKTMIITHRIVLIKQWRQALARFVPGASVQVLTAKSPKKDCDFYIMNAINVPKRDRDMFRDIGLVIVDEIHLIMSEMLSKCMCYFMPRFVLGLSATPYREDGMQPLLDLYFGKRKIYRKLHREHIVYKVDTGFVPAVEMAKNGRVNWGTVLDSQANDLERNEMIIRLVKHFSTRVFLILCKRVAQGKYLVQRLQEEGEDVTSLIGKQQTFEQKSRILVGTASKAGTGFDHPRLDALLMASDIQAYFIQYLGRCMRTQKGTPIIFDLVDKNPILTRHFRTRRAVYLEHGGQIKSFKKEFPDVDATV